MSKVPVSKIEAWLIQTAQTRQHEIKLGLERIKAVAERLNIYPFAPTVITVTGTNGKGSCVALLAEILRASNYQVGAYYSPHLFRFNERIQINGQEVDDAALLKVFTQIKNASGDEGLTYFEYATLAALLIFKAKNLDFVILEVGIGGRLDATNIIDPDIAVITSIGMDHMDYLGYTRAAISLEKAGIMRPNKPAICGDPNPPQEFLEYAKDHHANLYCYGEDFIYPKHFPNPAVNKEVAATALKVVCLLKSQYTIPENIIQAKLRMVKLPGRCHIISGPPQTILDVAHNPHAAQNFASYLRESPCEGKTFAVFAMLNDKDIAGTIAPLRDLITSWYIAGIDDPRGYTTAQFASKLVNLGLTNFVQSADVRSAYNKAIEHVNDHDRIVVFGSFHTVAPVLGEIQ